MAQSTSAALTAALAGATSGVTTAAGTPAEWIAAIGVIASRAAVNRPKRQFATRAAIILAVLTLASLLIGITALLAIPLGIAFVVALILRRKFGAAASPPAELSEIIGPLMAVLREEMAPDAAASLTLDLRGATSAAKRTGQRSFDVKTGARSATVGESLFDDHWLTLQAQFVDGSTIHLECVDHTRQRNIQRRNRRGKLKSKLRYRVRTVMTVRLSTRNDSYAPLAGLPAGTRDEKVTVKPGERRASVRMRRIVERSHPQAPRTVRPILDLIGGAYSRLAPTGSEGR